MRFRRILWALIPCLSGCLVDLYGGNPRLQFFDGSHRWALRSVGLGDTAKPGWTREFDPPVVYGGLTEVLELPVSGNLNLFLRLRDNFGKDTSVPYPLRGEDGDFRKLELVDDSLGILRIN